MRRDVFFKIGGFDNVDLFEDVIFSKKLRRESKKTSSEGVPTLPFGDATIMRSSVRDA